MSERTRFFRHVFGYSLEHAKRDALLPIVESSDSPAHWSAIKDARPYLKIENKKLVVRFSFADKFDYWFKNSVAVIVLLMICLVFFSAEISSLKGLFLLIVALVLMLMFSAFMISTTWGYSTAERIGTWVKNHQTTLAEPGATANEPTCHGLCSEQHTPRQAGSSLSFNVRQNITNAHMRKFRACVIAFSVLAITASCVILIIKPVDYTSDIEDLHDLGNVGAMLIEYAKENGRYPEGLWAINRDYFANSPLAEEILNHKRTAYSPPQSYPVSSLHMLLARPTKHGMVVLYADGHAELLKWEKPKSRTRRYSE
jgi:hypothetical protein